MLIPSKDANGIVRVASLSRRVNANSQRIHRNNVLPAKLIKKGEC